MANPRWAETSVPKCLPDKVAQLYYAHGLFLSSHPALIISVALFIILICCYPLLNLPLPGNVPQHYIEPLSPDLAPSEQPRWLSGLPHCYVQQIIIRSAVAPWTNDLMLMDAFRPPLAEAFKLLEIVENYQHENSSLSMAKVCLHVETVKKKARKMLSILPEYNCLILSPANLWQRNINAFQEDSNLVGTIFSNQNFGKGKLSVSEMIFGMSLKDAGIKRYPVRTKQRVVQFAVTVFLKKHHQGYLRGLQTHLHNLYPLHKDFNSGDENTTTNFKLHIYYPGEFHFKELIPLSITYLLLFFYMYFSVRKIELVRSKIGMAFSAVITVLASLSMSVGICFFFGLELAGSGRGREVFPYLVIVVGLENVLVLTKSVVSTAPHLDGKIRVAQGLSKEGWSITKNLLTEVTILTAGLLTFVPAIQEFCIFAMVGLLSDFFLQMMFFATLLSIDIRSTEHSASSPPTLYYSSASVTKRSSRMRTNEHLEGTPHSKSHPRLNGLNVIAPNHQSPATPAKIPKRLRLVHFWAKTRIVQRAFMVCMVAWIGGIVYSAGIIQQMVQVNDDDVAHVEPNQNPRHHFPLAWEGGRRAAILEMEAKLMKAETEAKKYLSDMKNEHSPTTDDLARLKPVEFEPWRKLSHHHWSTILSLYNNSVSGSYVTVLPPIYLAHPISPDRAKAMRNPHEKVVEFQWQSLAVALDPLDFSDSNINMKLGSKSRHGSLLSTDAPFIPSSPMELLLTSLLCGISVLVLAYTTTVLYRCVCSRNYAEWRSGWLRDNDTGAEHGLQVVLEAVPIALVGHSQEIECMATDGSLIVSSCLAGQIRVWDAYTGESVSTIDRRQYAAENCRADEIMIEPDNESNVCSDHESASPISNGDPNYHSPNKSFNQRSLNQSLNNSGDELYYQLKELIESDNEVPSNKGYPLRSFPDLNHAIKTNFSELERRTESKNVDYKSHGFNYGDTIKIAYSNFNKSIFNDSCNLDGEFCGGNAYGVNNVIHPPHTFDQRKVSRNIGNSFDLHQSGRTCVPSNENTSSPVNQPFSRFSSNVPTIWCIDCKESLIAIGCSNGRLEFWEATSGKFKCLFEDGNSNIGITVVKLIGNYVVAAKLSGFVDFYRLDISSSNTYKHVNSVNNESSSNNVNTSLNNSISNNQRRMHVRTSSFGSMCDGFSESAEIRCVRINSTKAHHQPITVMQSEGGRVVTGSQDHALKVFRLEDQITLYTLHGHCGPITCLFIDHITPLMAGSGSQDGLLCVWDLLTGACMYSLQAHDGAVVALTYSASYVISFGQDERLCVWERFQGHLLNTIQLTQSFTSSIVMLTHNLLIASKLGSLIVLDVRTGETMHAVKLGHSDSSVFISQILPLIDSVFCNYGNQLRIVSFPLVRDKND
nr:PREDICTED: sterol regulatory element-binding protein cleavage-activating protein [Bemisia tabaci]XP_018911059.1 PREDICTED: sterol regulatory element-binding protein cleavage-activating protein [Bemisia tabaci]